MRPREMSKASGVGSRPLNCLKRSAVAVEDPAFKKVLVNLVEIFLMASVLSNPT